MKSKTKLWSGRFKSTTHPLVERFTESLPFDQRLYSFDIEGSIAWTRALWRAKVLSPGEMKTIISGLESIHRGLKKGKVKFLPQDEDIHMAVERLLTERIGDLGGKLHTGRSRNDQVALDLRLFLRHESALILDAIRRLQLSLLSLAKKHQHVVMPGYTHLQRAQPILFSHHFLAYIEMLDRDGERIEDNTRRITVLPLGSGALAGTNFPIDRERIAKELRFSSVTQNSLDAVSDRDFVIEFLSLGAILIMHLSRLAEELVLWSTEEFGFIEIPDAFCTGSSLMPQKKNPDVLELIRGKAGRVYGNLVAMLTTMKSLPLSYNRDLQEDKEVLFNTVDTTKESLEVLGPLVKSLKIKKGNMARAANDGFLLATDLADYLVGQGLPFRKAHEVVGRIVRYCWDNQRDLPGLTLSEFQQFDRAIKKDVIPFLSIRSSMGRKQQTGSTAPRQVLHQIRRFERKLRGVS